MKPSVGRIVHFVEVRRGDSHCAAVITRVHADTCVNLRLFEDHASYDPPSEFKTRVFLDEDDKHSGTWHWPERVDE